jgi:hypothetical protein
MQNNYYSCFINKISEVQIADSMHEVDVCDMNPYQ